MKITSGKIGGAIKAVVYGPEGIGKTTFASRFPGALFIDTEGSTRHLDARRLPVPSSWTMLMEAVQHVLKNPSLCQTLVIDTIDWAGRMCIDHILAVNNWKSIETPGFGKGFTTLTEEFGRLINLLSQVIDRGTNVVLTAHAQISRFDQPDEMGSYDRWEMKLLKRNAPMLKEWADLVLFANYKTLVVKTDDKKYKAQGGQRVMYTSHHPAWDAKNRMDLPEELPFEFGSIAAHIPGRAEGPYAYADSPEKPATTPQPAEEALTKAAEAEMLRPDGIPDALWDLMQKDQIPENLLRLTVFKRGYYPADTAFSAYDPAFIQGVLIGAWPQVRAFAETLRSELPF